MRQRNAVARALLQDALAALARKEDARDALVARQCLDAAPQFLGFLAIALALWGVFSFLRAEKTRSRAIFFWLAIGIAIVGGLLSLGPTVRFFGQELGTGPYAWLYDAVHEAIVTGLELDEEDVARETRNVDRILPHLQSRVAAKK